MTHYSALLVCSGGGHLKQLSLLAPRMGIDVKDALWVTFDTGLSRSMLSDGNVTYATYAAPRDVPNILRNQGLAHRLLRDNTFDVAVSTGASLAVNFLPLAASRGVSSHYVESAARALAPSLTGRILARVPRVGTYAQYRAWSDSRWAYAGSVFDGFAAGPAVVPPARIARAVVSVGTTESYGFRRLIEEARRVLEGVDVLWQTGSTPLAGLGVEGRESVPAAELMKAIAEADVVVTHAGTGIALSCLEQGKVPVLVPRLRRHQEHVDDHQVQIASELASRGLAIAVEPHELSMRTLLAAAAKSVEALRTPPTFALR